MNDIFFHDEMARERSGRAVPIVVPPRILTRVRRGVEGMPRVGRP